MAEPSDARPYSASRTLVSMVVLPEPFRPPNKTIGQFRPYFLPGTSSNTWRPRNTPKSQRVNRSSSISEKPLQIGIDAHQPLLFFIAIFQLNNAVAFAGDCFACLTPVASKDLAHSF